MYKIDKRAGNMQKINIVIKLTGTTQRTVLALVKRKNTSMKEITCSVFPNPIE